MTADQTLHHRLRHLLQAHRQDDGIDLASADRVRHRVVVTQRQHARPVFLQNLSHLVIAPVLESNAVVKDKTVLPMPFLADRLHQVQAASTGTQDTDRPLAAAPGFHQLQAVTIEHRTERKQQQGRDHRATRSADTISVGNEAIGDRNDRDPNEERNQNMLTDKSS